MGEGGGGEEKGSFFPSPLFLFRFHFFPFSPETPDTQATQSVIRYTSGAGCSNVCYPPDKSLSSDYTAQ